MYRITDACSHQNQKRNIQAFGGDPDHVTVMGQSAGSAATYHIVNSPLTEGLIVGAIIESGVRDPHDPLCTSLAENYSPLNDSMTNGVEFLASLNISTIAEARAVPMEDLVTQFMGSAFSFSATLDYYALNQTYYEQLVNGPSNDVPILTGVSTAAIIHTKTSDLLIYLCATEHQR